MWRFTWRKFRPSSPPCCELATHVVGLLLSKAHAIGLWYISYHQEYEQQGHMKDGPTVLCRDSIMGSTNFVVKDPCPPGLLETLTVAHMDQSWHKQTPVAPGA